MATTPATDAPRPPSWRRRRRCGSGSPGSLLTARERTELLTDSVDDADLVRQHSPLMSPLVWDLAHIGNQEELWLLRDVGGREPMRPEIDPLYDAFEHPRAERPTLPLLPPAEARALRPRGPRPGAGRARGGPLLRRPAGHRRASPSA